METSPSRRPSALTVLPSNESRAVISNRG